MVHVYNSTMKVRHRNQHFAVLAVLVFLCCLTTGCTAREEALFLETDQEAAQTQANAGSAAEEAPEKSTQDPSDPISAEESEAVLYVDVAGAVCIPGVYSFRPGARVFEAIDAAGGFTADAAVTALNRAALLEDACQLYVPTQAELEEADQRRAAGQTETCDPLRTWEEGYNPYETAAGSVDASEPVQPDGAVNINTADVTRLMTLNGIGEVRARAIIDYRESAGGFGTIEDIKKVSGIGEGIFSKIKEHICV